MTTYIVDDHPLVRKGLAALLECSPDFSLDGEGACVQRAVEHILGKKPDMALIDLRLGHEDGLDIVRRCHEQGSACRFVVITSSPDHGDFLQAVDARVDGYVLKDALPEELLYAMRIVAQGRKYYDPSMMRFACEQPRELEQLTPREMEVLQSLGRGSKNSEIAHEHFVTEFTVKKYVSQILDKLNLKDRTQAALYAVNNGLVRQGSHACKPLTHSIG